jgi:hypothetical protein
MTSSIKKRYGGLLVAGTIVGLVLCGGLFFTPTRHDTASHGLSPSGSTQSRSAARTAGRSYTGETFSEVAPGSAEAPSDPDPERRLRAIEARANDPGADLDVLTYALVDPDEQVRARGQELFEAQLVGRN